MYNTFPNVLWQSCLQTTHLAAGKHLKWSWSSSSARTSLHFWNYPRLWWALLNLWSSILWWSFQLHYARAERISRLLTFWHSRCLLLWSCRILFLSLWFQANARRLPNTFIFHLHLLKSHIYEFNSYSRNFFYCGHLHRLKLLYFFQVYLLYLTFDLYGWY